MKLFSKINRDSSDFTNFMLLFWDDENKNELFIG